MRYFLASLLFRQHNRPDCAPLEIRKLGDSSIAVDGNSSAVERTEKVICARLGTEVLEIFWLGQAIERDGGIGLVARVPNLEQEAYA